MIIMGKTVKMSGTQVALGVAGLVVGFYMAKKGDKKMLTKVLYTVGGGLAGVAIAMAADAAIYKIKTAW